MNRLSTAVSDQNIGQWTVQFRKLSSFRYRYGQILIEIVDAYQRVIDLGFPLQIENWLIP